MSELQDTPVGLQEELRRLRTRVASLEAEAARWKKVEEALQLSEERYRMLVETMNEGVALQNDRGIIIYVNDQFTHMVGCSRQELIGMPADELVPPESREQFSEEMASPRKGERRPYVLTFLRNDGEKRVALASPASVLGPDGQYRGSFAVFTDITDLMRAEEVLAKERNLLRTMMDSIPDFAYVKDNRCRFIDTNIAHLRALGVKNVSEVVGKTDFDFFPEDLAAEYFENDKSVVESGKPILNKVERVIDGNGRTLWMMTFKAPLRDHEGHIVGLVGVSRDITELRLAEKALRESEDRFRLILENSLDVAYKIDLASGIYEYISPSAQEVLGLNRAEMIELGFAGFLERVHPDDQARYAEYRRNALLGEIAEAFIEYRFRHEHGAYRWVGESTTVIRDRHGAPAAEVGTIRDISKNKEAEEAIRAASRMEAAGTLAGGIAHEFNNLMVGVLGYAELLRMRLPNEPKTAEMLTTIISSAMQAGELAQKMLAFARGGKYEPKILNINDTVQETLRLEKKYIAESVRIEQNLAEDLWDLVADPVQMSHVVTNLTMNALEAIGENGRAIITTQNTEVDEVLARHHPSLVSGKRYVCLVVEDNGHGMKPEVLSRVFEPFFTTKFQGRGLGLAAVYGIVKNHGGEIFVDSHEGVGTSFKVYLPAAEPRMARPGKAAAPGIATGTETVLVVDDEPMVLRVAQTVLDKLGYQVLCASHGQEALEIVRKHDGKIDLAIIDMAMPIMGGPELFPLLRTERPGIRVILCSGYELDPAAQALLDAGATAFVRKPFPIRTLATEIRKALDG